MILFVMRYIITIISNEERDNIKIFYIFYSDYINKEEYIYMQTIIELKFRK